MKNIVILGSTGSIGTQTLDVVEFLSPEWNVLALTANKNIDLLEKQAKKFLPDYVVIMDKTLADDLKYRLKSIKTEVFYGMEGLVEVASLSSADLVINSIVGAAGLKPSVASLKTGNQLGLANKESMVIGGEILNNILDDTDQKILPIDSEHNAIFQILKDHGSKEVDNILLTASGGPFRDYTKQQLKKVTVAEALNHPNWDMGNKITIDSATLMNKGLEVIEAHWLFKQPYSKIKVIIHPESIIHSMVEFIDRSIMAELGVADMRIPIQNVLTYPEKQEGIGEHLDLFKTGQLNFLEPDFNKFLSLKLAYEAGKESGSMPVVLNAANEIAVNAFLNKKISFMDIPKIIDKMLNLHQKISSPSLEDIYEIDNWARTKAEEVVLNVCNHS